MQTSCGLVIAVHHFSVSVGWPLGHLGRRYLNAGSLTETCVWTLQRPLWEEDLPTE